MESEISEKKKTPNMKYLLVNISGMLLILKKLKYFLLM